MNYSNKIHSEGFEIINNVYSDYEINEIISFIDQTTSQEQSISTFRKSKELFAIRQFHKEIPKVLPHIFNQNLINIIHATFGKDYFITKSIYFDKPEKSNWFVAYHQDLTISVDKKIEVDNFENWTLKQREFDVRK